MVVNFFSFSLEKGKAMPDPTYRSLTTKDMISRFVESSYSGYKTETDGEEVYLDSMVIISILEIS